MFALSNGVFFASSAEKSGDFSQAVFRKRDEGTNPSSSIFGWTVRLLQTMFVVPSNALSLSLSLSLSIPYAAS